MQQPEQTENRPDQAPETPINAQISDKTTSKPSNKKRNFTTAMSQEQVKEALARIFSSYYERDNLNEAAISDNLSVRKLRVIIHTLRLSNVVETSVRKPYLCELLIKFLQSDLMILKYKKYSEEKERSAKRRAEKKLEMEHQREAQQPKENHTDTKANDSTTSIRTRSHQHTVEPEMEKQQVNENAQEQKSIAPQKIETETSIQFTTVPQTLMNASHAILALQKLNKVIWTLSDKITELEKAISILVVRISEAEQMYGL
ncbi:hypothetical protein TVAG_041640 [Trichomonas vaginalis G3]|uniref:Uncharacterized protein n=1 Tax=Trichomonas vaginalis (strain ATCC PRA-98 / G3) TaxID=412133 RepID=A2FEV8_TRIV3|nr:hypothetical protein TVAGG3_0702680 [Trichomonas vaginalis G3]EAX96562.1 hypothetical protein TVAG_041640 [Trichomonas vaginalis G3]KAI5509341.1 hypothetical protein TVAGG3_0702680 [Trichomonas vaginalis G3]|eukprot:XP_001309492.1 hypothetical protein [Trichomonas vaginalis G3]